MFAEIFFRIYYKIGFSSIFVSYKLNSLGFRDNQITLKKADDKIKRVMVLGDSYSYGYGVKYKNIFPVILENKYKEYSDNPVEVLNFSKMGWNTKAEVDFFQNIGRMYEFDILILSFTFNDIEREPEKISHPRLLSTFFQFTSLHTLIYQTHLLKKYFSYNFKDYSLALKEFYKNKKSVEWKQLEGLIWETNNFCKENNKLFVIFYFELFYEDHESLRYIIKEEMRKLAEAHNMEFVSIKQMPLDYDVEGYQVHKFDKHPNSSAHQLASDALTDYLKRNIN